MIPDRLRFQRVMAGEYRCDIPGAGTYTIDRVSDYGDWILHYHPTFNVHISIGSLHRTLSDARIAASQHALRAGLVVVG